MSVVLNDLVGRYPVLSVCWDSISEGTALIRESYANGGKLLIAGNGGSAADADHISGELLKGFGQKRPISGGLREQLGDDLADRLQGALPCIPLPVFNALLAAWNNDCDPAYNFAQLTLGLGKPGDVLLCISTSGNSRNIVLAAETGRKLGLRTIAMTGESGGKLLDMADICIRVPEKETFKVQELHLPIYHAMCLILEDAFFGGHADSLP